MAGNGNQSQVPISELAEHLKLGFLGEKLAQEKYQSLGFKILDSNAFNRHGKRLGEIDFVARCGGLVVFVEVKTRSGSSGLENAIEAVGTGKQKKLRRAILLYLAANPQFFDLNLRVDVCAVSMDLLDKSKYSVTILENAFEVKY